MVWDRDINTVLAPPARKHNIVRESLHNAPLVMPGVKEHWCAPHGTLVDFSLASIGLRSMRQATPGDELDDMIDVFGGILLQTRKRTP